MDEHRLVRLRLRLRTVEGDSKTESLWASPERGAGATTYRLQNHAFLVPLAAGDLVRAEPDGSGWLQIVDIVRPADAVLTVVGDVWDPHLDLGALLSGWHKAGAARSEVVAGALATVWADDMPSERVLAIIRPRLSASSLRLLGLSSPDHRTREALPDRIDFQLDGSFIAGEKTRAHVLADPVLGHGFDGIRVHGSHVLDGGRVIFLHEATALVARGVDLSRTLRSTARSATPSPVLGGERVTFDDDTLQLVVMTPNGRCFVRNVPPDKEPAVRRFATLLNAAHKEEQRSDWFRWTPTFDE